MSCPVCQGAGVIASCGKCLLALAPADCPKAEDGKQTCPMCLPMRGAEEPEIVELSVCGMCKGTGE